MPGFETLRTGQKVALKPADDSAIPPVHGEIGAVERGRIHVRLSAASAKNITRYNRGIRCVLVWDDGGRGIQSAVLMDACLEGELAVIPDDSHERRQMARVRTSASFTYEIIPAERVNIVAEEIRAAGDDLGDQGIQAERIWHNAGDDLLERIEDEFARLTHQIAELNAKLDFLVSRAEGSTEKRSARRYREIEDFSGSGLSFLESMELPLGAILRIDIELSRFPRQMAHCLGEVVRCTPRHAPGEQKASEFNIGVHFTVINEDNREAIIRCIFRAQRRQLRSRREQERS